MNYMKKFLKNYVYRIRGEYTIEKLQSMGLKVGKNFDAQLGLTGLVLTKLDGDSRGGSALSVVYCTKKPIKLTGTGEKIDAL